MIKEINWNKLSSHFKYVPAKTCLIKQGTKPSSMYVLIDGALHTFRNDILISTIDRKGEYFGEISILMNIEHSATVISLLNSTVIEINIDSIVSFLTKSPDVAISLASNLAKRLVEQNAQLARTMEDPGLRLNLIKSKIDVIDTTGYFDLGKLSDYYVDVRPNVEFIQQGKMPKSLYILVEGEVQIIKNGKTIALESTPGYYFGDVSILRDSPANASVKTTNKTTLIEIPAEKVMSFLNHSPEVAISISKKLAQRILIINEEYLNLMAMVAKNKPLASP